MFIRPSAYASVSLFALIFCFILTASKPVTSEQLVSDLSEHHIKVESTFTGAKVLLFGAIEANDARIRSLSKDVVVVVRGPTETLTARRKERVAGIWMNYGSQTFKAIPSYYAVLSTRSLNAIAPKEILQRYEIGAQNLRFEPDGPPVKIKQSEVKKFKQAVIKLKTKEELFVEDTGGVRFLGNTLFRASVEMPANVAVGSYSADIYLFRDGKLIHVQNSPLYISKSGFERFVYDMAQNRPTMYGIVAVIIALLFGWLGAALLRKS